MAEMFNVLFSLLMVGLLGNGVYDYLKSHENNACEMTWMYEYPNYMNIPVSKEIDEKFPKYGLYIYGEGSYARKIRNLKLTGVPVLFIPGNAGSYKQVRSLGSVSLRKSENIGNTIEFNYFAADFDEELSGLYGASLSVQTEYVAHSIRKILTFYKNAPNPPSSVVVVGHSMGGMVARALFTLPDFDVKLVNTIITQATPHLAPVIPVERSIQDFYTNVNDYWISQMNTRVLDHVTVVSTGGGYRDILVRNGLTSLQEIVKPDRYITTCTMTVPRAFVSTDHLCAVWCKQMVLVTTRALFDIIDPKTKQITEDANKRMEVFRHHYTTNPGSSFSAAMPREITLDANIPWEEMTSTFWKFERPLLTKAQYIAVPLVEDEENSLLVLTNLTYDEWICSCTVPKGQDRCKTCKSLTNKVRLLPSAHSNKKILRTLMEDLGESSSHVVILLKPVKHSVTVMVELYNSMRRHLTYTLPGVYDTIISYPIAMMDASAMLHIQNQTIFYSLHLGGMNSPLAAYTAHVVPRKCQKIKPGEGNGIVLSLNVPWANETVYSYHEYNTKGVLDVKLQSGRPLDFNGGAVHLEMFLHPACSYHLKLKLSTTSSLGQVIRFYGVLFPAVFVTIILSALGYILTILKDSGGNLCPQDIIWRGAKPNYIVLIVTIIRVILSIEDVDKIIHDFGLPPDDSHSLMDKAIWSPFLPSILYLLAFGTTFIQCMIMYYFFAGVSKVFAGLFFWLPESFFSLGFILQTLLGSLAIAVSAMFCGTAGLVIMYMLIAIKVMRLYHVSQKSNIKEDRTRFNLMFLVLLLVLWNIALTSPSLVIWAKNIRYSAKLSVDPSQIPCLVTSISSLIVLSLKVDLKSELSGMFGSMFYMSAVIVFLYGLESVYRIPYIIATMLTLIAVYDIQQYFLQSVHSKSTVKSP